MRKKEITKYIDVFLHITLYGLILFFIVVGFILNV